MDIYTSKVLTIPSIHVALEKTKETVEKKKEERQESMEISITAHAPFSLIPYSEKTFIHSIGDPMILYGKKSECPGFVEWILSSWKQLQ